MYFDGLADIKLQIKYLNHDDIIICSNMNSSKLKVSIGCAMKYNF